MVPNIEFGPRDYLKEMLRLMQTVFGGNSKYLSMLASKADECFHFAPQAALEAGSSYYSNNSSNDRIVELEDDGNYPQALENGVGTYNNIAPFPAASGPPIFDFGSLSEASMAWLGSMDVVDDVPFSATEEAAQNLDLPFQHG